MLRQSVVLHVVGCVMCSATQPGVAVTFINCCPYDVSRKKLATLPALVVITCWTCVAEKLGATVLLKFAMITSTLLAVAALATTALVTDAWRDRIVMRSGVIDVPSALARPWTRTCMPGSRIDGLTASRS